MDGCPEGFDGCEVGCSEGCILGCIEGWLEGFDGRLEG